MINMEPSDLAYTKFELMSEEMNINIITDKFPDVKDLMLHTPRPVFYAIKFWVRNKDEIFVFS
jgi:hypothetical protein